MRRDLAPKLGRRGKYSATFSRFGSKNGYKGPVPTALFVDIRDSTGKQVTDHIWFTMGKQLAALGLEPGARVRFEAWVDTYLKGYMGHKDYDPAPIEEDYRLVYPTKFRLSGPPDIYRTSPLQTHHQSQ